MAYNAARTRKPTEASLIKFRAVAIEYCSNGYNKTAAVAKVYGWKTETATKNTWKIFSDPITQAHIDDILRKANKNIDFGPEKVLKLMQMYAESGINLARFKKKNADGQLYWDFSEATEEDLIIINTLETSTYVEGRGKDAKTIKKVKIGATDPLVALDKLARVYGLYQDNLNITGEQSMVDRINAGRKRANLPDDKTLH